MDINETNEGMSPTSEDREFGGDNDVTKLVPVTESIRYRRRAQSAEQKAGTLAEQLNEANQKIDQMSQDLDDLRIEQQLTHELVAAGATDLEAAVLMAKARMSGKADADLKTCLDQLKREKGYLFAGSTETAASRKTAGAKDRGTHSQTTLERAAKKAARTGKRTDLQQYLKLRRNLL
jgi:hypothetical protein